MKEEKQDIKVHEEAINLNEVYKKLNKKYMFRSKKTNNLLSNFAKLIAQKSSFAHKVHKEFNKCANLPTDPTTLTGYSN